MTTARARRSTRGRVLVVVSSLLALSLPSLLWEGARAEVVQAEAGGDSRADDPHVDPWWYEAMGLDESHPLATGKGVTIALLDDGLQRDVPALQGADIEFMRSPCLFERDILQREAGRRATWNDGLDGEHGTAMASLILGSGVGSDGPGSGIRGAAPDAKVLFFDVDDERQAPIDDTGTGLRCNPADKADTYLAAVEAGADIISVSNGGVPDVHGPDAVSEVVASNQAVFVAANNDSSPYVTRSKGLGSPGGVPGVISVNALDKDNVPWEESLTLWDRIPGSITFGWWAPTLSASGLDIDIPGGRQGAGAGPTIGGTSPATALVAGVMALVKERHPDATANQLVQHAIHYTSRFKKPRTLPDMYWAQGSGFGLVGAPLMLNNDPTVWPDENPLLAQPNRIAERYPTSLRNAPPAEAPDEPASDAAGVDPASESVGGAAEEPQAGTAASSSEDDSSAGSWLWLAGGAALLLALLAAALLRRRSTPAPSVTDADRDHHNDNDNDPRRVSHGADTTGE